jgi:hypothetical protein
MSCRIGRYKHYNNERVYEIESLSINESNGEHLVTYRDVLSQQLYTRPVTQFFGRVENENRIEVNRFEEEI